MIKKIQIISDKNSKSLKIKSTILKILSKNNFNISNVIIVVGGDGFMLQTLKKFKGKKKKILWSKFWKLWFFNE